MPGERLPAPSKPGAGAAGTEEELPSGPRADAREAPSSGGNWFRFRERKGEDASSGQLTVPSRPGVNPLPSQHKGQVLTSGPQGNHLTPTDWCINLPGLSAPVHMWPTKATSRPSDGPIHSLGLLLVPGQAHTLSSEGKQVDTQATLSQPYS